MEFPYRLRAGAMMIVMAGLLALGCKHSSSVGQGSAISVSGTVTYTRHPLVYSYDGNGVASAVPGPAEVLPARGAQVRLFQLFNDIDVNGRLVPNWRLSALGLTDVNGYYDVAGQPAAGYATFVEVDGIFDLVGGHGSQLKVIADPAGIASTVPEPRRGRATGARRRRRPP